MVSATKHRTVRTFNKQSNVFIAAQKEPNWGPQEDANVKRRLQIFFMKPLHTIDPDVASWLSKNAMHCLVWAGTCILRLQKHSLV